MAIKYIQKHKDGSWGISNSKTGKSIKNAKTEKEALALTGTYKNVEAVMILRKGSWKPATGWDMELVNITKAPKKNVAKKKAAVKKATAKKPAAKKATTKKPAAKKATAKKPVAKKKPTTKKSTTIVTTTTTTTTSKLTGGKKVAAKKKPTAKKATAKKPVAKKPLKVIDNTKKKPVAKKAPVKAKEVKKAPVKAKEVKKAPKSSRKQGLPGWAGFIIGLAIITITVGSAFLIGYYV